MLKNKLILLGVMSVFLGGTLYAMEDDASVLIKNSSEVAPFKDTVVAYATSAQCFIETDGRYYISDSPFFYGYVNPEVYNWNKEEKIYCLSLFLRKDKFTPNRFLENMHIKRGNLYMRKVNPQEARTIVGALNSGEARFSQQDDNRRALLISKLEEIAQ